MHGYTASGVAGTLSGFLGEGPGDEEDSLGAAALEERAPVDDPLQSLADTLNSMAANLQSVLRMFLPSQVLGSLSSLGMDLLGGRLYIFDFGINIIYIPSPSSTVLY